MRFRISLIILFSFINLFIYGQPNLIIAVNNNPIHTTSINYGDSLSFTFKVKNIGNVRAPKSHTRVYISKSSDKTSNSIFLADISTEALSSGSETDDINFIMPLVYNIPVGPNYIILEVDCLNEVVESVESNLFLLSPSVYITSIIEGQQNLPYPIIFIHGLNSNDAKWNDLIDDFKNFFGWSFGGNLNFCLNQSESSTNKYIDITDFNNDNTLSKADMYTINFDIDRFGNLYPSLLQTVFSNQSSIVKQGIAVARAINYVLKKTGRDKVILVGHSMGGLASREYLQNPSLWQEPNLNHHIAKLLTIGTPHLGSDTKGYGFSIVDGLNENSEAVRDLRTRYSNSQELGVYLFGGYEDYNVMDDYGTNFLDVDVNCNGVDADGSYITGLNEKDIPNDLNYSCIIGTGGVLQNCNALPSGGGDDVVCSYSADLKNFYPTTKVDTFIVEKPLINLIWHSSLPKQTEAVIKGLDESNEYENSYNIEFDKLYFANFSIQSKNSSSYFFDYDDYKFILLKKGKVSINVYNINISQCYFDILNSSKKYYYSDSSNGKGYLELSTELDAGEYYFEISGLPLSYDWQFPYAFKMKFIPTPEITPFEDTAICQGNYVVLKAPSGYNSYQWNDGITSQIDTIRTTGTYKVRVTDSRGLLSGWSDSIRITVDSALINPIISKQFANNNCDPQLLALNSTRASYFEWYRNDTLIINASNQIYVPLVSGIYHVKVFSQNRVCSIQSDTVHIQLVPETIKEIFVFNGTGNWTDSINWCNRKLPPNVLPINNELIINPISNGECILNIEQHIDSGAFFTIRPNAKFRIIGDLIIGKQIVVNLPTITTNIISSITQTTAVSGGSVLSTGGATIIVRGICFGTSPNPTLSNTIISNGSGIGNFISNLSGLTPATTYYIRAYATNSAGTSYGNELSFTTLPQPSYTLGQSYGGGKIFYIDNTGNHGLIAATSDISSSIHWSLDNGIYTAARYTAIGTGQINTTAIVNALGTNVSGDYAANICDKLILSGYSDWFLPSKDELNQLYINRYLVGGFSGFYYWSSTESDNYNSWTQVFSSGTQMVNGKGQNGAVRAIRAF